MDNQIRACAPWKRNSQWCRWWQRHEESVVQAFEGTGAQRTGPTPTGESIHCVPPGKHLLPLVIAGSSGDNWEHYEDHVSDLCSVFHPAHPTRGQGAVSGSKPPPHSRLPHTPVIACEGTEIKPDMLLCSTGAPQGTISAPFLFTLYSSSRSSVTTL